MELFGDDEGGLDECCADELEQLLEAWLDFRADPEGDEFDGRALARHLDHGEVASEFLDVVFDEHRGGDESIHRFLTLVVDGAPGAAGAQALVLRAANAELQGRALEAEADLTEAVRRDPDLPWASAELAQYASDRGDAERAARLLQRAGLPADHPDVAFLRRFAASALPEVGRNDPCPCGSGRKYKQCHLGATAVTPIEDRAGWLARKVADHVAVRRPRVLLDLTAAALTGYGEVTAEEAMALEEGFLDDAFLIDLATLEGGGIDRFLTDRADLLPGDEVALAEVWARTPRRLWEVVGVAPGVSLSLRDDGSGEAVTVTDPAGSWAVQEGQLLLAVVAPVGTDVQFLGRPVIVEADQRASVVDLLAAGPDAAALAEWYGSVWRPLVILSAK